MNTSKLAKTRWLVAVKAPKEKTLWLKTQGYNRNEVFAFPTKKNASDFIADVSQFGVQCLLAKA